MSGQNTSPAVMQQRHEALDSLDDFPTPMWATRALMVWLRKRGHQLENCIAREPCANRGYMVVPMLEEFLSVDAADCHDYGVGYPVRDFLIGEPDFPVDWTFMNPPFRLAQDFIHQALLSSDLGVAVFVRSAFLEGAGRYHELFSQNPPSAVLQFSERVVLHRSSMRQKGEKYTDALGFARTASSATAYSWVVWDNNSALDAPTELHWVPPSAPDLERPADYDLRGDVNAR